MTSLGQGLDTLLLEVGCEIAVSVWLVGLSYPLGEFKIFKVCKEYKLRCIRIITWQEVIV